MRSPMSDSTHTTPGPNNNSQATNEAEGTTGRGAFLDFLRLFRAELPNDFKPPEHSAPWSPARFDETLINLYESGDIPPPFHIIAQGADTRQDGLKLWRFSLRPANTAG